MKKVRAIVVLTLVVAMLSTIAFAATATKMDETISYEGGEKINVSVYAAVDITIDQYSTLYMAYDPAVFNFVSGTGEKADIALGDAYGNKSEGSISWSNDGGDLALTSGDVIFTATFNVVNDEAVDGKTFVLDSENSLIFEIGDMYEVAGTTTVKVAKTPSTVEPGTPEMKTIEGATNTYSNVWTNGYTVTTGTKTISAVTLNFASYSKQFTVPTALFTGGGNVVVKVAVIGAPADATATLDITEN